MARRLWSEASIAASAAEAERAVAASAAAADRFAARFVGVAASGPSLYGPVSRGGARGRKAGGPAAAFAARAAY